MNFNINRVKIVITVPSQNVNQERNDQNENNNSMWQFKIYQRNDGNNRKMELQGNCMLVPIYNPNKASKDDFTEEEALMLDKMHKERIKLADAILVVNVDGYIGDSTRKEIEYAKSLGKEILYYTDLSK